ncbi:hypothetical protein BJ973_008313 [Actinoplanes tereljensis]|uniref:Uncharacterized protein n=1 Tax=Paractinoplanes tereljensis TaxID=571912 RepID=A0A919TS59_9ACTN|nr:hypothetical protein [Actinoplanes tereljensis]GIF18727.1 hypothetical protein Ate02nite_14570 [Actinoplanes tereljensis]
MPDGVQIDTDGVNDFGRGMQQQTTDGFADIAGRGADLHRQGVGFGSRMTPSDVVTEAKVRYAEALAHAEANLRAYQQAAGILADVAEQIARQFASADLNSAQAQQQVQHLIHSAMVAANRALGSGKDGVV